MSITTLRDGSGRAIKYRARHWTPDGASRMKDFEKKGDAERHLANVVITSAAGSFIDSSAGKITFGEYATAWAASQPHRTNTKSYVEQTFRVHAFPTFEKRKLASIRPSEIQAWVTGLPLAPSTAAVAYGKVAAVFRAAVDDRVTAFSPCARGIKIPPTSGVKKTMMSVDEVRVMAEAVNPRYRALMIMMAGTGLCRSEAVGITADRVNFLKRTITVDRQLITYAKSVPEFAPTKTPSSNRVIPVPDSVLAELS